MTVNSGGGLPISQQGLQYGININLFLFYVVEYLNASQA